MSNRIKVAKSVQRRSSVEQALMIRDDVLAVVASANSRVSALRQVTENDAIEVVWRALNETRYLTSFAIRRDYAFAELKSFIDLAQGYVSYSAVKKYSDLLNTAHPFSAAPHAMTASALVDAQMQWYLADHRVTEETAPLLASAFSADSSDEQRKYALTRLNATAEGATALEAITAAFSGDGNSYWARRMRAMAQRRDHLGRFAEEGGGMRLPVKTADGSVRWLTGRSVGADPNSNTFDVETPRGIVRVPAGSAEGIEAYLPGKENPEGYSPSPARLSSADAAMIINEADLQIIDSPAGWEPVKNFQGKPGEKAFTDGVYTVAQSEDADGKKSFRLLDENGEEVGTGENWTSMLDQSMTDALGGAERPTSLPEDILLSGLDDIANNETAGAFRQVAKNIAAFLRDGTAPSDRTPEQLAEQAKKIANNLALDKQEASPNRKFFERKFQGFEDDFRNGSDAIIKKLQGEQISQDKKEEQKPVAKLPEAPKTPEAPEAPASEDKITNPVPQGAYAVDTGEYLPEGRIDEASSNYTDDPKTLARMFGKREIADALEAAILGDDPSRVSGSGSGPLEFDAGTEYVPAEALYNALKLQRVKADKFVNDTYKKGQDRLDRKEQEPVAELPSEPAQPVEAKPKEDIADALDRVKDIPEVSEVTPAKGEEPIEDVNTAEEDSQDEDPNYPALIEGLTEDELQSWVDSGFDHVPFLPKNDDIKLPEDYTQIDPNPIALEDLITVEEGDELNQEGVPVGWTDDPYVLAQNFDTQDLVDNLEYALEPRNEDSEYGAGRAPFTYTDENGDDLIMEIPAENIRDALQLQGEDTNAILQDIADRAWASQADIKPVASDVEEGRSSADLSPEEERLMMEGEGISEEPSVAESIAERVRGIKPGGGLTIDPLDGTEPTEGFVVAHQGYNKEYDYEDFMGPNGADYIADFIENNLDKLSEEGNHLGFWHDEDNNEMVLDVVEVIDNEADGISAGVDRNQQAIYDIKNDRIINTGGTGDRAAEAEGQPSEGSKQPEGNDQGTAPGVGEEPSLETGGEAQEPVSPKKALIATRVKNFIEDFNNNNGNKNFFKIKASKDANGDIVFTDSNGNTAKISWVEEENQWALEAGDKVSFHPYLDEGMIPLVRDYFKSAKPQAQPLSSKTDNPRKYVIDGSLRDVNGNVIAPWNYATVPPSSPGKHDGELSPGGAFVWRKETPNGEFKWVKNAISIYAPKREPQAAPSSPPNFPPNTGGDFNQPTLPPGVRKSFIEKLIAAHDGKGPMPKRGLLTPQERDYLNHYNKSSDAQKNTYINIFRGTLIEHPDTINMISDGYENLNDKPTPTLDEYIANYDPSIDEISQAEDNAPETWTELQKKDVVEKYKTGNPLDVSDVPPAPSQPGETIGEISPDGHWRYGNYAIENQYAHVPGINDHLFDGFGYKWQRTSKQTPQELEIEKNRKLVSSQNKVEALKQQIKSLEDAIAAEAGDSPKDVWGQEPQNNLDGHASVVRWNAPVTLMQPGDVTVGDNFTITEIGEPDSRGKVTLKGYFPGHPIQEKKWNKDTPINFLRGIAPENMPQAGDLPEVHKPLYWDFQGGKDSQAFKLAYAKWRGLINAARSRWTSKPPAASEDFNTDTDVHRVKVHANELKPGDVMADPTKGNFVIVSVSDPNPNNPEHANAVTDGLLIVKGYYPGHEIQEKQWKPRQEGRNGREYKMDVIRNSTLPESGPLPAINQGEVVDGVYVRNTDPAFVKDYNLKIAQAAARYDLPKDAPAVDYPQQVNPALREAPRPVPAEKPSLGREPNDPFAQGAFADMMREAGSWAQLRENMKGKTYTFFDYETTGLDHTKEKPVQIGAVKIKDGVVIDRFNMYINPGQPLEGWSKDNLKDSDGNPLTDEWLQQQVSMAEAHQAFADWVGADNILGAQNSKFDRRFLEKALADTGVDFTPAGYIDPQSLARAINVDAGTPRKSVSLGKLTQEYGVTLDNWHSADADAEATAMVFGKLLERAERDNLANGQFDIDATHAQIAADEEYFNSVTLPNFQRDMEAWNASQAVSDALAGKEVSADDLVANARTLSPEAIANGVEDVAGAYVAKEKASEPSRLANADWITNDANTRPVDREDVRANSIQVGDFMQSRDGSRWFQVTGVDEVEDGKFAITRVDVATGQEHTTNPYWANTRLDGVRRSINPDSLKTGDNGDKNLTEEVVPDAKPATMLEHTDADSKEFTAETLVKDNGDGTMTADTKVFDNEGDVIEEKSSPVSSIEEAQMLGDSTLQALREEINALTAELAASMEEPKKQEVPAEVADVRFPTPVSETNVTDKDGVSHQLTIVQNPRRTGGGYELAMFKDDGTGNWTEVDSPDNFTRFETLQDAMTARDDAQRTLAPTPQAPTKKPVKTKEKKQEEKRNKIQEGAYLRIGERETDNGAGVETTYTWVNPDGSTTPVDMNDSEQTKDLTSGRVFNQPNSRVIEGGEAVRDALSNVDVTDSVDEEDLPPGGLNAPGTPMIGDRAVRPHGTIDKTTVTDPSGKEYNVELQAASTLEGDPEKYNIIIRDPEKNNIELAYQTASSRDEADQMYAELKQGIAEGRVAYEANPNYGVDILDAQPGDSSPYITSELLPKEVPFRVRVIGGKAWQKYSNEHFLYGDGRNQARLGDRVVHTYDGWNRGRGEGTIMHWEVIANPGDQARVGYAYVAFDDGSWGIYSTDFLFLNGRGNDVNDERYAPPVSAEAQAMERPKMNIELPYQVADKARGIESTVRRFETTEKYTVELRKLGGPGSRTGQGLFKTKVVPYVSERGGLGLDKGVAQTRRAYQLWLDRQERVRQYRERAGLPELTSRVVELANPGDRVLGPIWRRATGLGGGEATPNAPQAPTPTPNAPEVPQAPATPQVSAQEQLRNSVQSALDAAGISGSVNIDENGNIRILATGDPDAYIISQVGDTFNVERYNPSYTPPRRSMLSGATQEDAVSFVIDMFGGPNDNGGGNGGTPPVTPPTAPSAPQAPEQSTPSDQTLEMRDFVNEFNNNNANVENQITASMMGNTLYLFDGTNENILARIEWSENAQGYSSEIFSSGNSRGLTYYADLDEAGREMSTAILNARNNIEPEQPSNRYTTELPDYIQELRNTPSMNAQVGIAKRYASEDKIVDLKDLVTNTLGDITWNPTTNKYDATIARDSSTTKSFDTPKEAGDYILEEFKNRRPEITMSNGGSASRPYPIMPKTKRLNPREVENVKNALIESVSGLNSMTPVEVSVLSNDDSLAGLVYKIEVPSIEDELRLTQNTSGGGWLLQRINSDGTASYMRQMSRTSEALSYIGDTVRRDFDKYHMDKVSSQRNALRNMQTDLFGYDGSSRATPTVDSSLGDETWSYSITHKPQGFTNAYKIDVNINPEGESTASVSVVKRDGTFTTVELPSSADFNALTKSIVDKVNELTKANKEETAATKRARIEAATGEVVATEEALNLTPNPMSIYARFIRRNMRDLVPVQQLEFDGSIAGVANPNFDRVDENGVLTPNGDPVSQKYYQEQGWEAEKASQIAHAGNSRPSVERILGLAVSGDRRALNEALGVAMGKGVQFGGLKVSSISVAENAVRLGGTGYITVNVSVNQGGSSEQVGKRTLNFRNGKLSFISNDYLRVGNQGSGFASLFNQFTENWYIANGADHIQVSAAGGSGWSGAYVWAVTGFNWHTSSVGYSRLKGMDDHISGMATPTSPSPYIDDSVSYARAKADMERLKQQAFDAYGVTNMQDLKQAMDATPNEVAPTFPTPREMAMVGWSPELRETAKGWFGKNYMIDKSWAGKKNLQPTATERVQNYSYEAMKKAIDVAVASGMHSFENNSNIKNHFGSRITYEGDGAILAPYADELTRLTGYEGQRSVSQLSPPAKAALGKYLATVLADNSNPLFTNEDNPSGEAKNATIKSDFVSMLDALQRDRLYFEPNREKLSSTGDVVKNLPSSVFDTNMTPGKPVGVTDPSTGEALPFTITKLAQQSTTSPTDGPTISGAYAGASDIWKLQNTETGEVFFVKNASTETNVQSEVASNALARALGIVGLPVIDRQGDANSTRIITSELGTNLSIPAINADELVVGANSSPELDTTHLVRMSESPIFNTTDSDVSGHVSINNALGMLVLDAVIQNDDRGSHNVMMVRGNDVPNYSLHDNVSEAWIPIPFDNADGVAVRTAIEQTNNGYQSPYDYLTTSLGESNELGKQFFDRVGPVTFKMLMDKRIEMAVSELKSKYSGYMSQAVMDMFSDRLNEMKNYTADTWSEIYG